MLYSTQNMNHSIYCKIELSQMLIPYFLLLHIDNRGSKLYLNLEKFRIESSIVCYRNKIQSYTIIIC